MKVFVLGASGMLGHMVERYFLSKDNHVTSTSRFNLSLDCQAKGRLHGILDDLRLYRQDLAINCIGAIKPRFKTNEFLTQNIFVNSIFPHYLADYCDKTNVKLVHITTDCVFSGLVGRYTEDSPHDALDEYGKSKSMGEPSNCMVLRTSIIGPEKNRSTSLMEWLFRQQKGATVNGFNNHLWNGVTTLELAKVVESIVENNRYKHGTYHIYSEDVSKARLLSNIKDVFGLDVSIKNIEAPQHCDRRLRTVHKLNSLVTSENNIGMLRELKEFVNEA